MDGEAPDVTDTGLLRVPPLSERGTFMELAQHFGGGAGLRATLAELRLPLVRAVRTGTTAMPDEEDVRS